MAESSNKRVKIGSGSSNPSINLEQKISMLEQRIHELQCIHFPTLTTMHASQSYPTPLTVYTDPLINMEISIYHYREQQLTKKILELQDQLRAVAISKDISLVKALKDENIELKKQLRLLSHTTLLDKISAKDKIIDELTKKLVMAKDCADELQKENDDLRSQNFLLTQAITSMQQSSQDAYAHVSQPWETGTGTSQPQYADPTEAIDQLYQQNSIDQTNDSPVLEVEEI